MRIILKILHTLSASGLIGGLAAMMIVLALSPQGSPETYADMRQTLASIARYALMPSLGVALVTGLLAMIVHSPFLDKDWVWIKALLGVSMFEGVLVVIEGRARAAARLAREIAEGGAPTEAFASAIRMEWAALGVVMALSIANVVLGVWRPRIMR